VNLPAAIEIVKVASLPGVKVAEYEPPLPANVEPMLPADNVTSVDTKLVVDSLEVNTRAIVASLVVAPELTVVEVIVIVGTVKSIVTEPLSAVVSAVPAFPAASVWLAHENVAAPASSSPLICRDAVHEVPEPPIVAVSPSIVHARDVTDSLAVIASEIVSPLFAKPVLPSVDMAMFVRVG
jgi:hypothetical protein